MFCRAENPKYDTTEWDELQKKFGNITETRRDKLQEDDEADEKARQMEEAEMKEMAEQARKQLCLTGELDEFLNEDDEKFMQEYRYLLDCETEGKACLIGLRLAGLDG
jgi:hypothetical protein